MIEELTGLAVITFLFGGPVIAIILNHYRKLAEMKLKAQERANEDVLNELRALKNQMADLRDTTTKYDLSFDAALQRIESRVGSLEQRVTTLEEASSAAQIGRMTR